MKTALEILNQVEPNGELLDTDQALEAMELYAVEYANSLKEDMPINKRRVLFNFFLWFRTNGELYVDKSIEDMIDIYLSELPSPPKTEK